MKQEANDVKLSWLVGDLVRDEAKRPFHHWTNSYYLISDFRHLLYTVQITELFQGALLRKPLKQKIKIHCNMSRKRISVIN